MALDHDILSSVAQQMLEGRQVQIGDRRFDVRRMSRSRLRSVVFVIGENEYRAIEQNSEKTSRWAQLARDGHKVVQFRDEAQGRYVAVSVDGKIREYK